MLAVAVVVFGLLGLALLMFGLETKRILPLALALVSGIFCAVGAGRIDVVVGWNETAGKPIIVHVSDPLFAGWGAILFFLALIALLHAIMKKARG